MSGITFVERFAEAYAWNHAPTKRRFRFRKRVNHGMEEEHRLALTLNGVIDRSLDDNEGLQSSDYSTYQIFEEDDLVFKLIDLENIKTSRVGYVPRRGIMSPAYIRLNPSSEHTFSRYYYWFFYGVYLNKIFNGLGGGVRQNLTSTDLLQFPAPLPPLSTQKAIADFLDRETDRIDRVIRKKQRLVELLGEKRQALITHAVTRGLDTDVSDRDRDCSTSVGCGGVITLQERVLSGTHPLEWSLFKLHGVFRVRKGFKNTRMQEDNLLSLSYGMIVPKSIDAAEGLLPASFETYQIVEPGNIVMRLIDLQNDLRSLRQGLVTKRGIITSAYDVLELREGHDSRFWAYTLLALDLAKYYYSLGGGVRQSIKFIDFPNDWIAVPNYENQNTIADFLDRETDRINQVIKRTQESIILLREFRSAMITAAVTGQIDVRNWKKNGATDLGLDQNEEIEEV